MGPLTSALRSGMFMKLVTIVGVQPDETERIAH